MKRRNYGLYALALAVVVVGALWAGVPFGTVALLGLLLVCPLMMFFMMRGMHGADNHSGMHGGGYHDRDTDAQTPPDARNTHDHNRLR